MTEQTDRPLRCAYCLQRPERIAEAQLGTAGDDPLSEIWAYLCEPDMHAFNESPWPSDDRAAFLDRVVDNLHRAVADGTLAEVQPRLLTNEELQTFDRDELEALVRDELTRLDPAAAVFAGRFPEYHVPPAGPDRKPDDDPPGTRRLWAQEIAEGVRVGRDVITWVEQGQGRGPHVDGWKGYCAQQLARALADRLDLHAFATLAYDDLDPELATSSAYFGINRVRITMTCPWRQRDGDGIDWSPGKVTGPDSLTGLRTAIRELAELSGRRADRLTVTQGDLIALTKTEEFVRVWGDVNRGLPAGVTLPATQGFLQHVLGVREVVVTTRRVIAAAADGRRVSRPVHPDGVVLLDSTADDDDHNMRQLLVAQCEGRGPGLLGGRRLDRHGPVAYYAVRRRAMPAHVEAWVRHRALCIQHRPGSAVVRV